MARHTIRTPHVCTFYACDVMSRTILSVYNFVLSCFYVDTMGGSENELLVQLYLGIMSEYNIMPKCERIKTLLDNNRIASKSLRHYWRRSTQQLEILCSKVINENKCVCLCIERGKLFNEKTGFFIL